MLSLLPFQLGLYGLLREREAREAAMVRTGAGRGMLNPRVRTDGHPALAAGAADGDFRKQSHALAQAACQWGRILPLPFPSSFSPQGL